MSVPDFRTELRENQAQTHPGHSDGSLRGRTYAIPFTQVWAASVKLASGGLRGWEATAADEDSGILRARCKGLFFRRVDDLEVRVSLDENAQTRVDMSSPRKEGGDSGRTARRIRRFFSKLDRAVGAGPGKIIDPTIPLIRDGLLLAAILLPALIGGCGEANDLPSTDASAEPDSLDPGRNFQARSYERHIVFLTFQGDSTLLVPWAFSSRTRPDGVDREVRGWLARGDTWDPFLFDRREGPTNPAPWRILPQGPVRLVVGLGDALETIIFQEGGRNLEMNLGRLLVEWSGQKAQTYRIQEGTVILSERTVEGHILDMTRGWAAEDGPPGDWGVLLSGDSVQIVLEDLDPESGPDGGSFSLWARVQFLDRQWQGVRFAWSDVRAFEPARRDVPMSWDVRSPEGDLVGSLTTEAPFLEASEGSGPVLPVIALFQVTGNLTLAGVDYPIHGFIHHVQH